MLRPLTTQLVGSYAKPAWLARHDRLLTFDGSWWRPDADVLQPAKEDAARLAIYEQERVGLNMLTDGEQHRQMYASHFYTRIDGVDTAHLAKRERATEVATGVRRVLTPTEAENRSMVPRIVDELRWSGPLCLDELRFLKRHTRKAVKATVVGPLTAWQFMADEYYGDEQAGIMAMAAVLNQELLALDAEGADLLQIDEPSFHTKFSLAHRYGAAAINRMVAGVQTPIVVHVCYGYAYSWQEKAINPVYAEVLALLAACNIWGISIEYEQPGHMPDLLAHAGDKHIVLGLLNLGTQEIETPEHVARRLREAAEVVSIERLHPAPDCGMWHLSRETAYAKLRSLVLGTETVRHERGL